MAVDKISMSDEQMDQVEGGTVLPYRVQPGDSLAEIAQRYHVTVDQLIRWNDIKDPSLLIVGQKLKIKF